MKTAIVSVINDLTTDQRADRTCRALVKAGFRVILTGRKLSHSLPLKERDYGIKRMRLLFTKGPCFYAEYNFRLFFFLLFRKCGLLISNDLDTLPANYLVSRIRRIPLIHDCHEYFRGMPELNGRETVRHTWKFIEDRIFPKLKTVVAVNRSIADLYHREYGNEISVVRNVPLMKHPDHSGRKSDLGIPEEAQVILYQGAVNIGRGLEEAILAMKYVRSNAVLLIIGTGDILDRLRSLVVLEKLEDRVIFTGQVPFHDLYPLTCMADIGLSIEKDISINYHYCLPNKFLDYIQARVPVLVSPFPEMLAIVEKYRIGETIESHDPALLARDFDRMLSGKESLEHYRAHLDQSAAELCWEKEEETLLNLIRPHA
jgi:glycosyltransferase involved in cell wall biosynthesis